MVDWNSCLVVGAMSLHPKCAQPVPGDEVGGWGPKQDPKLELGPNVKSK